ncbi:MAG: nicotinate-nucleotide diphosphorylase (carboxylating) [Gallionellales bacterium 35-53-114]|nr:MAG: nicotinate-nucleotide diphosphorylase (carboxylating) [Gallionellales bacterium 35-53-114]OYZ62128.1 MAG: nicotinate-nucleotide diphosphorylase (carboxylating) [Gallionellales bacterium 24-53-125]OZB07310.1 MAG: nicotinate-nucleotide diphosphorylase (carboxylating) [Gallionellales bacterium 39-52-133]
MTNIYSEHFLAPHIHANVSASLLEDMRQLSRRRHGEKAAEYQSLDYTALLIPKDKTGTATVITRQDAVLCGRPWFDACFKLLNPDCKLTWHASEGDAVKAGQTLCEIQGKARAMLTAERSALNFLQTLSATATATRKYVELIAGTHAKIFDTRKTLPGLRIAQKYAVKTGGGENQRLALFDGVLIKENHIMAAGGIREAMTEARKVTPSSLGIQIEVESLAELREALEADAKLILLDNFSLDMMREAVKLSAGRAELEASGGVNLDTVRAIAETGVDRISIGALTKDIQAVDLSMRFKM